MGLSLPVLAQAGVSYALARHGASQKRAEEIKGQRQSFNQRMELAEKYGIHPLQAIGGAGTFTGSGGGNVGAMLENEKASRARKRELKTLRKQQIQDREDQQSHELTQKSMDIAAEDARNTRMLNEQRLQGQWRSSLGNVGRSIYNWIFDEDEPLSTSEYEYDDAMNQVDPYWQQKLQRDVYGPNINYGE